MKKLVLVLVIAGALAGGAWAQDEQKAPKQGGLRFSAGGLLDLSFGGDTNSDSKSTYFGFGIDAFFDAKYVVASIGFDWITPSWDGEAEDKSYNYLSLGLLGKYPIALSETISIAPAVGFEYQMFLNVGDSKRADVPDALLDVLDNFALKFGAIADFTITGNLYARAGLLGAFRLAHKDSDPADSAFGADINIGVGYRF
jgi:hypothetical protein